MRRKWRITANITPKKPAEKPAESFSKMSPMLSEQTAQTYCERTKENKH